MRLRRMIRSFLENRSDLIHDGCADLEEQRGKEFGLAKNPKNGTWK